MNRHIRLKIPNESRPRDPAAYQETRTKSYLVSTFKLSGRFKATLDDQTLFQLIFLLKFIGDMLQQQSKKMKANEGPGLYRSGEEEKGDALDSYSLAELPVSIERLTSQDRLARGVLLAHHLEKIHRDIRKADIRVLSIPPEDLFDDSTVFPTEYTPSAKPKDEALSSFTVDAHAPQRALLDDASLSTYIGQIAPILTMHIDDWSGLVRDNFHDTKTTEDAYGELVASEWLGFLRLFAKYYDFFAMGNERLKSEKQKYFKALQQLIPVGKKNIEFPPTPDDEQSLINSDKTPQSRSSSPEDKQDSNETLQSSGFFQYDVGLFLCRSFLRSNRGNLTLLADTLKLDHIKLEKCYSESARGKSHLPFSNDMMKFWNENSNVKKLREQRNRLVLNYLTQILSYHQDYSLFSLVLLKQNYEQELQARHFEAMCRVVIDRWREAIADKIAKPVIERTLDEAISNPETGKDLFRRYQEKFYEVYRRMLELRNNATIMREDIRLFNELGGHKQRDSYLSSVWAEFITNAGNRFLTEYEQLETSTDWHPPSSSWDLPSPTYFCHEAMQYIFRLMKTEIATAKDRLTAECTLEGHPSQEGMKEGQISAEGMKEGRISEEGMEEEQVIEGQQQEKFYPIIARLSAYAKRVSPLDPEAKSDDNANGRLYDEIKKGLQLCYDTGQYQALTILFLNLFLPKWSENPSFKIIDDEAELKDTEVAITGDESTNALIRKCEYFFEDSARIDILKAIWEIILTRYSVKNIISQDLRDSAQDTDECLSDVVLDLREVSIVDLNMELVEKTLDHFSQLQRQSAEDAPAQPGAPEPGRLTPPPLSLSM
jgi:hypothetical protein